MSIGTRIKECREKLEITQEELANLLGVSKGAIGNYESGIGYPKVENMTKLFKILKTDANYLFQDEIMSKNNEQLTRLEEQHIKKYRTLDEYGKEAIDNLLDTEAKRCEALKAHSVFTFRKLSGNKVSAGTECSDIWKIASALEVTPNELFGINEESEGE